MDESMRRGFKAEDKFLNAVKHLNWTIEKAKIFEDIHEHWDFYIKEKNWKVDIKGAKKLNRYDKSVNYDIQWLEFENVGGNAGWLYGKADYIVFELKNKFIFVNRLKLVEYAESILTNDVGKEIHCRYSRKGFNDLMTLVYTDELLDFVEFSVNKRRKIKKVLDKR